MEVRKIERRLRDRIKFLEDQNKKLEDERDKHRIYWQGKMRWFLELLAEQKTPSMIWLVEDMAKHFQRCGKWYW
jgi:hypothetical protein